MRLRLDISYDGTEFHGWAVQPGRRTVAGVLGDALATLFRGPVPMVVAGRTDAGVHATGQVAHIDVDPGALAGLAPRHLAVPRPGSGSAPQAPDREHLAGSPPAHPDRVHRDPRGGSSPPRPDRVHNDSPGGQLCTESGGAGPTTGTTDTDIHTHTDIDAGLVGLRRRLAGLLPVDVRVRAVGVAPDGFDARFSALRRHYRYRILSSEWGVDPLRRNDTLAWRRPLDAQAMQNAANLLTGLHDFAAYCKPREGATTIRDLQRLTVTARPLRPRCDSGPGPDSGPRSDGGALVLIHVTADAFCHSMVRSLVGALLAVGDGRSPVDHPADLLAAGRRTAQIAVAPAHGLTLVGVDYPPDADLAARAVQTRALRPRSL